MTELLQVAPLICRFLRDKKSASGLSQEFQAYLKRHLVLTFSDDEANLPPTSGYFSYRFVNCRLPLGSSMDLTALGVDLCTSCLVSKGVPTAAGEQEDGCDACPSQWRGRLTLSSYYELAMESVHAISWFLPLYPPGALKMVDARMGGLSFVPPRDMLRLCSKLELGCVWLPCDKLDLSEVAVHMECLNLWHCDFEEVIPPPPSINIVTLSLVNVHGVTVVPLLRKTLKLKLVTIVEPHTDLCIDLPDLQTLELRDLVYRKIKTAALPSLNFCSLEGLEGVQTLATSSPSRFSFLSELTRAATTVHCELAQPVIDLRGTEIQNLRMRNRSGDGERHVAKLWNSRPGLRSLMIVDVDLRSAHGGLGVITPLVRSTIEYLDLADIISELNFGGVWPRLERLTVKRCLLSECTEPKFEALRFLRLQDCSGPLEEVVNMIISLSPRIEDIHIAAPRSDFQNLNLSKSSLLLHLTLVRVTIEEVWYPNGMITRFSMGEAVFFEYSSGSKSSVY